MEKLFSFGKRNAAHWIWWAFLFCYCAYDISYFLNSAKALSLGDLDYLAIAESLLNTTKGNWFFTPYYQNGGNYLAHHFSPSLVLLVPFSYLSEFRLGYEYGLFFCNLVFLCGWYVFCNREFGKLTVWHFFPFFCVYLFRVGHSFHMEILFVVMTTFFLFFRNSKNPVLSWIFFVMAVLSKEDSGIYLGIYFFFEVIFPEKDSDASHGRDDDKTPRLANLALSFGSFFYSLVLAPNCMNWIDKTMQGNFWNAYDHLGKNPLDLLMTIVSNPGIIAKNIFQNQKVFWEFFLAFGILTFLSPKSFLMICSMILLHTLSSRIWHNELYAYYSWGILPFAFFASFQFFRKLETKVSIWKWTALAIILLSLAFRILKEKEFYKFFPSPNERYVDLIKITEHIPAGSKVSASFYVGAWVKSNSQIFPFPTLQTCDYILIDTQSISPYEYPNHLQSPKLDEFQKRNYYLLETRNGFELWKRI